LIDAVVVVPCYNEERRLPAAEFERFLSDTSGISFLFVDDGSRDGTLALLRGLERAWPERARVLALPANRGKAFAVRAGVLRAFELEPALVGYWDADLAAPLAEILTMRALLEQRPAVQMVLGARVVLLGRHIERRPLRHYVGRLAATVISLVLSLRVYDTQCGAKLFRNTPDVRALFREPFVARWLFDVEILARWLGAQRAAGGAAPGEALCEHPLAAWADVGGSKVGPGAYFGAGLDLMRLYGRYLARPPAAAAPPPAD
jgi:glycosyltransferase involved in cell wall biosynthesis